MTRAVRSMHNIHSTINTVLNFIRKFENGKTAFLIFRIQNKKLAKLKYVMVPKLFLVYLDSLANVSLFGVSVGEGAGSNILYIFELTIIRM